MNKRRPEFEAMLKEVREAEAYQYKEYLRKQQETSSENVSSRIQELIELLQEGSSSSNRKIAITNLKHAQAFLLLDTLSKEI